ncbi:ABC transporter permease [Pedobacter sp. Du54]|uniref:ABC transporter permease n=1 Tax=Pedobacter anseongensis TaxID=3133439 RepID=UPI0030A88B55
MFKLNLKIALRNLWRSRSITAINVGGLAVALAAFILVMMYATYETTFDQENENYDQIYLIGRASKDFKTNFTSPPLAKAIKANFPEVEKAGKMKPGYFQFSISSGENSVYTQKYLIAEYDAVKMFNISPKNGLHKTNGEERAFYLSTEFMETLFPGKKDDKPEPVVIGPKSANQTGMVSSVVFADPHSNIQFDALSVGNEIGANEGYGYNNYYTYIQVKPGTNIENLTAKINHLYRAELAKADDKPNWSDINAEHIFLDPLKNLHLRPKAGSDANYKILIALSVLGALILVIACINFTNLSIAQAAKRAKEVGVKKVMGAYRFQLTTQFFTEILMQCFVATILGLMLAELILPQFNALFNVNLIIWRAENKLLWQLPLILIAIAMIAGTYPAIVLSGFKPALVLKGNFQTSRQSYWLKNGLLVFQFTIAVIFITGLLIINSQLKYMRTEDVGFKAEQVITVKNIAFFNKPADFAPIRDKIMKIEGVKSVTLANSIPDGSKTGANSYTVEGKEETISFVDVDFDYFETLGVKLAKGRFFNREFKSDTAFSAILNESAVAKYGLTDPIGKTIKRPNFEYKIVGVVKDVKAQGFESKVEPTIYSLYNPNGNPKLEIILKVEENKMSEVISALRSQWSTINKLDGDTFRYSFLDELYGRLFKKQEQLQSVFFSAALLTIFIAVLGLFAFAKYITNGRIKEIAVRKILGAGDVQLFKLLNTAFFKMVLVANIISWPIAYILTKKWLETFAYSISVPVFPFVASAMITILLTIVTVTVQARGAIKANPVDALKYE